MKQKPINLALTTDEAMTLNENMGRAVAKLIGEGFPETSVPIERARQIQRDIAKEMG